MHYRMRGCRFWRTRMAAMWGCLQRCARNLQKTWWPRLNRAVRIGAITTLALHLSVSKTLPLIGGMPGQDWCISSYSLASTTLPEQSGAVFSGLWVWCFTLTCIAVITLILFPVLSFGATLGRSMCLVLFLVILSWMTVMRLPMTHKVAPFASDVDTSSMTSFAYIYIPYTAASVILSQQNRAFDTDLHTGLMYIANYNIGVLSMALLGWALFTVQVMLPPWSSQRHNVRVMLSQIMCDVRGAVTNISLAFADLRHMLLREEAEQVEGSYEELRLSSKALQESCQALYKAIGQQTKVRVAIVASSTEPYWMYPGPGVFLFPFFARCFEVLIHNCMTVITLARHIDMIACNPLRVRLEADETLAGIFHRTEPLLHTTARAYTLCATLLLIRPTTLRRAEFKKKMEEGLEQLDQIDSLVGATFSLLRSPSMQVPTRQLTIGDDVSVCLRRLMSRASIGSNASVASDQSGVCSSFSFMSPSVAADNGGFGAPLVAHGALSVDRITGPSNNLLIPHISEYRAATAPLHGVPLFGPGAVDTSRLCPGLPHQASAHSAMSRQWNSASRSRTGSSGSLHSADGLGVVQGVSKDTIRIGENSQPVLPLVNDLADESRGRNIGGVQELRAPAGWRPSVSAHRIELSEASVVECTRTSHGPNTGAPGVLPRDRGSFSSSPDSAHRGDGVSSASAGLPERYWTAAQKVTPDWHPQSGEASEMPVDDQHSAAESSSLNDSSTVDLDAVFNDLLSRKTSTETLSHSYSESQGGRLSVDTSSCCNVEDDEPVSRVCNGVVENAEGNQPSCDVNGTGTPARALSWSWPADSSMWNSGCQPARALLPAEEGQAPVSLKSLGSGAFVPASSVMAATTELRQELRLSKLIVSLYSICAMDTQELCSTVRGACLAVLNPSWQGARQNFKMMTLSLAMVFIQLYYGLRTLVRVDKWRWRGPGAFYRDVEVVHCIKLLCGLGFLFGCCLFYGKQIDHFLGGPTAKGAPQTAKQWVILGFLCAHSFTYEGNTHKGLKRAAGTALGGLAVELALVATTDYLSILFFTFFSIAGAVFIFASPTHPASEFDREFGYIGQVFIWTVTFILDVIWTFEGTLPYPKLRDTVVRSRVLGNLVGICFSMLLSGVPPFFSAENAARMYCATLLKTCRRCILLMNATFLSITRMETPGGEESFVRHAPDAYGSTYPSSLATSGLSAPSSPITSLNKTFECARMWKFSYRGRRLTRREWYRLRREKKKHKPQFHDYMLQVEELLRHHSTRLLVVARMLYDEGSSSKHVPLWRVDKDVGEIMNKVEYLVMSVVDTVDNLCHLALDTDPDFAALVQNGPLDARASWLAIIQQDRRNWHLLLQCRAGNALQVNLVRMVKAQSACFMWLAKEITAAGLSAVDRIIAWDWCRFSAAMPRKYLLAFERYVHARSKVGRYNSRIYESLAICGKERRDANLFNLDEWRAAIFSLLLIMEKCESRNYFMDEIHTFQAQSICRTVYGNLDPELMLGMIPSSLLPENGSSCRRNSLARQVERVKRRKLFRWRSRTGMTLTPRHVEMQGIAKQIENQQSVMQSTTHE